MRVKRSTRQILRFAEDKVTLQHVTRQILVLDRLGEDPLDVCGVDGDLLAAHVAGVERQLVEQALEDRVQAPRADVLGLLVHDRGEARHLADRVLAERQGDAFRAKESGVLDGERVLWLPEDADEIILGERL